MKNFSDLGIKIEKKSFKGDKIKITKILNKEIVVHDFKITESKCYKNSVGEQRECLQLQLTLNEEFKILFTSATYLLEAIKQINKEDFPFKTTIIEDSEVYLFS